MFLMGWLANTIFSLYTLTTQLNTLEKKTMTYKFVWFKLLSLHNAILNNSITNEMFYGFVILDELNSTFYILSVKSKEIGVNNKLKTYF